jgi:hypothetical protein
LNERNPSKFVEPNIENKCICQQQEDIKHIYQCKVMNNGEKPELGSEKIFVENINEQNKVFRKYERNFKQWRILKENQKKTQLPSDPIGIRCTPQNLVMD